MTAHRPALDGRRRVVGWLRRAARRARDHTHAPTSPHVLAHTPADGDQPAPAVVGHDRLSRRAPLEQLDNHSRDPGSPGRHRDRSGRTRQWTFVVGPRHLPQHHGALGMATLTVAALRAARARVGRSTGAGGASGVQPASVDRDDGRATCRDGNSALSTTRDRRVHTPPDTVASLVEPGPGRTRYAYESGRGVRTWLKRGVRRVQERPYG